MTKFYTYNIQLLPNSSEIKEVGALGYKKLLRMLREENDEHRTDRTLDDYHFTLAGDSKFGPDEFHISGSTVYGNFIKYTKTDEVLNLNNKKLVFQNSGKATTISKKEKVPFLFDAGKHYLCIEGNNVLNTKIMVEALKKFLQPIADRDFIDHELTVNSISEPSTFEAALSSATAFKRVELHATFENGHEETQGVLQQLKESKTKTLNVTASGGTGVMSKLPPFIEELARAAVVVGALSMSYLIGTKKFTFDSTESPMQFVKRRNNNETDESFFARVHETMIENVKVAENVAHQRMPLENALGGKTTDVNDDDAENAE